MYEFEIGNIVYDSKRDENLVILGKEPYDCYYRCLTYDFNCVYISEDRLKKVGNSYALFKVAYDMRS